MHAGGTTNYRHGLGPPLHAWERIFLAGWLLHSTSEKCSTVGQVPFYKPTQSPAETTIT
jgi:hypothetical protein